MASIGLKYLAWAKMATEPADAVPTFAPGKVIGKAVSTSLTVTRAEGELSADDMVAEYASEFSSASFTAEADNISLADQAEMYGAKYVDDEFQASAEDTAPYAGIGGYQVLMIHGVRKYRSWVFPKSRASIPDWTGTTKGTSITFGTQPITARIMAPTYGPWYYAKEFTTEAAAKAHVDTLLNIATWRQVNVQVQGGGAGKSVSYVGAVQDGENAVLTIEGTPTALYDNGVDQVSAISEGKYTISAISEDHNIAVIFGA